MTFVVLRALLRNRIGAALALFVVYPPPLIVQDKLTFTLRRNQRQGALPQKFSFLPSRLSGSNGRQLCCW